MNLNTVEARSIITFLVGLFLLTFLYYRTKQHNLKTQKEKFLASINKFNQDRLNTLSPEQYQSIYEYENNLVVLFITEGKVGSGNQRDGDELIENSTRDSAKRIMQHLHLPRNASKIHSLGYDFKKQTNFLKFIQIISSILPNNTHLVIPINQTWFIIEKYNENVIFSVDTKILNLNQIFDKISV